MRIRAFTAFLNRTSRDIIQENVEKLTSIKVEAFSKRLTLPHPSRDLTLDKIVDMLPQGDILFSLGGLRDDDPRIEQIPDVLSTSNNVFIHVLLKNHDNISTIVKVMSKLEPEQATRFAILLNEEFLLSPYYPTSSGDGIHKGFGMSLIYVNEVMRGEITSSIIKAKEIGEKVEKDIGLRFLGIDPSISPWMEESVGDLIETRLGKELFSPGSLSVIKELNNDIMTSSVEAGINPLGFSELMLPIAEDETLRKRVLEGKITLTHLVAMSTACVAGLDMVGIEYDLKLYTDLIKDLIVIHFLKKRPYGIRIIPSHGEEKIFTKSFGIIPVIKTV
ncbi:hypothetical protein L3N51_01834 [Metallosphaera sp. J1]|uniref:DUF711 family protein n=1 Tax=Metallosphaera javensis (ex Hofmann et al. 2022) TaxID=99938 RepID=UPI001EDF96E6|nr:DUF711 family protein [Metallosphaera javensis (ex Hofmann et al. 2022)]MCG3109540.1 hypothetical protein [Metallosphaera javensis (ex Hofmann et al. 2022)]